VTPSGERLERRGPFLLLYAVNQQLSSLLAQSMDGAPLTPGEFAITSALRLIEPARPSRLAEVTGLRPTTLSNHLRGFEERGLVRRRRDPADGRASLLSLTPRGLRDTEACFPQFGEAVEQFRKAAADEGLVELDLLDQLESVHRALESARDRLGTMDQ
jgi:DNA-binding MarR family transcriptional regulator